MQPAEDSLRVGSGTKADPFPRYSRQIFMDEIGVRGQRKIMASKVLIVGAGGLGSPVIQYLAAAGVGTLAIADYDAVELHNLNRQIIHTETSIGMAKVESAATYVQHLNSHIKVQALHLQVTDDNVDALVRDYELVVDGSDNFATRYRINDACIRQNKPLVYGSILGFEGQVAVFNYKGSKQLRDLFPEPPAQIAPDCDSRGVLGPLPGIIGSMMAMQVLKLLSDLPVDTNMITLVDTYTWSFTKLNF